MPSKKSVRRLAAGAATFVIALTAYAQIASQPTDSAGSLTILPALPLPLPSPTPTPLPAGHDFGDPLSAIDFSAVKAAVDASPIRNLVLIVGTPDDGNLLVYQRGNFDPNKPTAIASASKWLVGTLAERMIEDGKIGLQTRPTDLNGLDFWANDAVRGTVTFEQALSLRSGFNAQPLEGGCVEVPLVLTLKSCVRTIYDLYPAFANGVSVMEGGLIAHQANTQPGALMSYGPHHFQIAEAMMEAAGEGRNFNQLFADYVANRLQLTKTTYDHIGTAVINGELQGALVPDGTQAAHVTNPWGAGGAISTGFEYAKILNAFFDPTFIRDPENFTRPRTLDVARGFIPGSTKTTNGNPGLWQYALGSWVECTEPAVVSGQQCASKINSSPGAYGWLGWIDRGHRYYAVIARAEEASSDGDPYPLFGDGPSVVLERSLQPLIVTALNKPR